jgi:hypothetical protein
MQVRCLDTGIAGLRSVVRRRLTGESDQGLRLVRVRRARQLPEQLIRVRLIRRVHARSSKVVDKGPGWYPSIVNGS